jgi:monoamine oxidase
MPKRVIIIGCGFAGMSAAAFMAKKAWDVLVLKNMVLPVGLVYFPD